MLLKMKNSNVAFGFISAQAKSDSNPKSAVRKVLHNCVAEQDIYGIRRNMKEYMLQQCLLN